MHSSRVLMYSDEIRLLKTSFYSKKTKNEVLDYEVAYKLQFGSSGCVLVIVWAMLKHTPYRHYII